MSSAKIVNPDEVRCTLQFTMSLKDWKQVRTTLNTKGCYAEMQLISEITDLVYQLEGVLCPGVPNETD